MSKYYIYTFFYEQEEFIKLEALEKYFLMLMYSNTDENNRLTKTQGYISELSNTSKYVFSRNKNKLKQLGFIEEVDKNKIIMNIPRSVNRLEKIYINQELVEGKYKNLRAGTKLFYIYGLYLQQKTNEEYIIYRNYEIKKPFTGSINTIKKYSKELQDNGLLDRVRSGISYSYHFIEIE